MTTFRELHEQSTPLLLPNAWDVASALAFAEAGFAAIGTTSFGVAARDGNPDGGRTTKDATRDLVRLLAPLPAHITADIEDGYADDPGQVADFVADLASAGVNIAGVNIEDSSAEALIAPKAHADKIVAIKERTPEVFVNARVDTYWLGQDATVAATLERAARYVEAGADGIFIPGATDPDELRAFASTIPVPVNVLASPKLSLAELGALGIRRVSTGSLPYRAALDAAVGIATGLRGGRPAPAATPYPEMQQRLLRYQGLV